MIAIRITELLGDPHHNVSELEIEATSVTLIYSPYLEVAHDISYALIIKFTGNDGVGNEAGDRAAK